MTPKRPRDPNQLAKSIIDIATFQTDRLPKIQISWGEDKLAPASVTRSPSLALDNARCVSNRPNGEAISVI